MASEQHRTGRVLPSLIPCDLYAGCASVLAIERARARYRARWHARTEAQRERYRELRRMSSVSPERAEAMRAAQRERRRAWLAAMSPEALAAFREAQKARARARDRHADDVRRWARIKADPVRHAASVADQRARRARKKAALEAARQEASVTAQ